MNGLEDKKIMPEKVLLNTLVVEKKKHYLYNVI